MKSEWHTSTLESLPLSGMVSHNMWGEGQLKLEAEQWIQARVYLMGWFLQVENPSIERHLLLLRTKNGENMTMTKWEKLKTSRN